MNHAYRLPIWAIISSVFFIGIIACNTAFATPTPTPIPTNTPPPTATPVPTLQPGDVQRTVIVNDVERSYFIYIPPGLGNDRPVPVVFVFHGFSGNAAVMQMYSGFKGTSDQAGAIVIYPEGINSSWNAGACCGDAVTQNVDESAFVRQMLSDVETLITVDTKRIYATGFSNGGMLSYRLACEMSDVFAAIGAVAGALVFNPCEPQEPVSLIHIHGVNDKVVPFGDNSAFPGFPSVEEDVTIWAQINGCTEPAQTERFFNDTATLTAYRSCNSNTAVELYALDSGGHVWPTNQTWSTSQLLWDFFAAHPKP